MKNKKFFNLADITPEEALKVLKKHKDGFPSHLDKRVMKKLKEEVDSIVNNILLTAYGTFRGMKDPMDYKSFMDSPFIEHQKAKILKLLKEII